MRWWCLCPAVSRAVLFNQPCPGTRQWCAAGRPGRAWVKCFCDLDSRALLCENKLNLYITVTQPWQTFYYHCDYLGSPRLMTDASGNVVWKQDYYAFGSDYGTPASGNTHKFTGHVQDAATGQYYAKARHFTTNLGRWSQPEPMLKGVPPAGFLVKPQLLNPYVYCSNNPLMYVDPNGLWQNKANADAFIQAALDNEGTEYGHNYPDQLDCTGLVLAALTTLDESSVNTQLFENWNTIGKAPRDGSMAKGLYDEASKNGSNIKFVNSSEVQAGDLIVANTSKGSGHVEIVKSVDSKTGKITTVAASSGKGKVITRGAFNPWSPKNWWKKVFGDMPKVIRITEDKKKEEKK